MKCVFCAEHAEGVQKTLAYCKGGRYIRESRVFKIDVCDRDRKEAEQSFETPFRDIEMINLYKRTLRNGKILT